MSKLSSYKKRKRAEITAFSPEFKQRVREIRRQLELPEEGFPKEKRTVLGPSDKGFPKLMEFPPQEAVSKWYEAHVREATGKRLEDLPRQLPPYYWYFPKEIAELIEDLAYSTSPYRPGFHPDVPLDRFAMDLVREFGLPEEMVNEVKKRILVEERGSFSYSPKLQPLYIPMEGRDEPYYFVLIAGIDGSTTKKDWDDIWQKMKRMMELKGIKVGPSKRPEEKIEMRDLIWWHWRKVDGLTYKDIADRWQRVHPSKNGYSEDTISRAVMRIEKMMAKIPQADSRDSE